MVFNKGAKYGINFNTELLIKELVSTALQQAATEAEQAMCQRLHDRIKAWYADPQRKPPHSAFTAGELRDFARLLEEVSTEVRQAERECAKNLVQSTLNNWKAMIQTPFTAREFEVIQMLIDHAFQQPSAIRET